MREGERGDRLLKTWTQHHRMVGKNEPMQWAIVCEASQATAHTTRKYPRML